MSTTYVVGFGSIIAQSNASGGTYVKVAQSIDLDTPDTEIGKLKITNNDSPTGGNPAGAHEYAPGMTDPGALEFQVVFAKGQHEALMQEQGNGFIYWWKETFPDGTVCNFPAYLAGCKITGKTEDEAVMGHIKLQLTGPALWS
jgi:hypothetical protein